MVKKIRISAGYDNSENLTKRLLSQFLTPDINLNDVEFVFDDTYDTIIFFNHINLEYKPNTNVYIFPHEPSWSGSHQKHLPNNSTIFGFDKSLYIGNCIEGPAHTFYGGRGPWVDPLEFWCYDNLKDITFNKTKNISSSVTKLNENNGLTCTYPQRYEISKLVDELEFVDFFGGGDCSPKKQDALVTYKFNLAIENEHSNNWITEKFYDGILTDTVPIYYGCKNIKELYPEDGYILIEDINDIDGIKNLLTHINENSERIYNSKLEGMRKIKQKYFQEFNLLKKIIEL
jgi:hypothetical protein